MSFWCLPAAKTMADTAAPSNRDTLRESKRDSAHAIMSPAPTFACRTVLQNRQIAVEVACPCQADLTWLAEFLAPAFHSHSHESDIDYTVDAVVDEGLFETYVAARPAGSLPEAVAFVLDQRPLMTSWWNDPASGQPVFLDPAHAVLYLKIATPPGVKVVAKADGRLFRGAVMRIVRELAMAGEWTRTSAILHAAAFASDEGGVLIAGPKRSGKTSLLLHCLRAAGAAFLANDRVVLSHDGSRFTARGIPSIVSIRSSTLELFPDLSRTRTERWYQAHLTLSEGEAAEATMTMTEENSAISPAQLCHALHVPMATSVPLRAVFLPHVDLSQRGFRIQELSPEEAEARFEAVLFAAGSEVRISEIFRNRYADVTVDLSHARELWSRAVRGVPVFGCRIGRGAFNQRAELNVLSAIGAAMDGKAGARRD